MSMAITPIKRSRQLRELSHQHHNILLFVWKIRQGMIYGIPADRIGKYCEWFWRTFLKSHLDEEETVFLKFYPKTEVLMNNLLEDHEAIRTMMDQVLAAPSYPELK